MNKIFSVLCLGGISAIYLMVIALMWFMSMVYLIFTEIIGTKRFMKKFHRINKIIREEYEDTIRSFKQLFGLV